MNMPKILYWFVFINISLYSFYLQYKGFNGLGITIMLLLGFFHLIVFYIAEDLFIEIRLIIRESVELIIAGISRIIVVPLVFMVICIMAVFFFFKKIIDEPREFFKTLQRL